MELEQMTKYLFVSMAQPAKGKFQWYTTVCVGGESHHCISDAILAIDWELLLTWPNELLPPAILFVPGMTFGMRACREPSMN